ncbi:MULTISPECIES: RnfABCDGE type electron transport complex subunit G [Pseudomonas]|uniref:Ion-translocating oxidoreductase complex subunit G n=1 Tax=Pseudomonas donghuensis TaxID=1163398 RepID=A0AAP0SB11_9PSED|nr:MULTISPECIES: RnfABCDGE type electron transport complex subunit G [Pseudomonas]MDF9894985.1 electron transport complex protein RnfG [Pseudomonas vranovensis]KDN97548.1 RnfABCDGE type electron transport complex subunit G [Pseudomonas donghuensis]MBF4206653.1 RnfABCDGE type electron transport complex subunit G [Pseudomonas donghuensis]MBS7597448.1 RnfABCDGE type electron transport complex subunit G [Pseudomonas sp. RC2C2]MCP6690515.1 RnfABCDGE type electron transport complex subunit G [Pseudo
MNTTSIRSTALLLALAVLAVGGTVLWHQLTAQRITDAEQQLKAQRWLSVLPEQHYDNQPLQHPLRLGAAPLDHSRLLAGYLATLQGQPRAVVLHSQAQGYGGPLDLLIAIDDSGRLIGVKVLQQQETPGLGGKLVEPGNTWLQGFVGSSRHTIADTAWALKRDSGQFDQLAGATVTSRAVIQATHDALRYFDEHRQQLLTGGANE